MISSTIVRVDGARFVRDGVDLIAPFSLRLEAGEMATVEQPNARAAKIAARIAAGIVKPTSGRAFIADFDTRLQPAQAKRLVGFVPAEGFRVEGPPVETIARALAAIESELRFRAAVWGANYASMRRRAESELAAYTFLRDGQSQAHALALALALSTEPALIVLELPPAGVAEHVAAATPGCAIVSSSVSGQETIASQVATPLAEVTG